MNYHLEDEDEDDDEVMQLDYEDLHMQQVLPATTTAATTPVGSDSMPRFVPGYAR
jgi:hypothetical protein